MTKNKIKEIFNCEVYLRLDITSNKNLCICDYDVQHIYKEYDLIKVFDYFKYKEPIKFLNFIVMDKDFTINNKPLKDLTRKEALLELIQNSGKTANRHFSNFKDLLFLDILPIHSTNYEPTNERIFKRDNKTYLNTNFPPYLTLNTTPKLNNNFPMIKKIIFNVLGNKQENYDYFINHMAYKIQNPTLQLTTNFVIIDKGGVGKTLMCDTIFSKLFNRSKITQTNLDSDFNDFLINKQYVFGEEIENFTNNKKLKTLTSADTLTINSKNEKLYEIPNYSTFILFSNDIKAIHITDDDRRWNILGGGKSLNTSNGNWENSLFKSSKENQEFFNKFNNKQLLNIELKNFYCNLLALKTDKMRTYNILNTPERDKIILMSKPSHDLFLKDLCELEIDSFTKQHFKGDYNNFRSNHLSRIGNGINEGLWISSQTLYNLYTQYCQNSKLLALSINNFCQRIKSNTEYGKLFDNNKFISYKGTKFQAYKLIDDYDENITETIIIK